MTYTEALEVCTLRRDMQRPCMSCRFNGEECVRLHREMLREHTELLKLRKELANNDNKKHV